MQKISAVATIVLFFALTGCAAQSQKTQADKVDTPASIAEMLKKAEAGDFQAQEEACSGGMSSNTQYKPTDGGDSWCEKAAEQGSIYAMLDLSSRYDMGQDREIDQAKGFYWLKRATETKPRAGDIHAPEAYGAMAVVYELGLSGQKPDQRTALKWHMKAADAGWSSAYLPIARSYESGIGVRQDFKAAAKWYLKSAENANDEAAHALALLYIKGQGLSRDLRKAFFWDSVGDRLARKYTNCTGSCPTARFPYYFGYVPHAELDAIKAQADAWETGKPHP